MLKPQTKVGLLLMASFVAAMIVIVNLGDIRIRGYEFYILFDDLADLPSKPSVKISGVDVGRVSKIEFYQGRARVRVWLQQDIRIHKNTVAKILKMGMIGNTYVSLTQGTTDYPFVEKNDTIEGSKPLSYEDVIGRAVEGLEKVVDVFERIGGKGNLGKDLGDIASNLKDLSIGLNNAMGQQGEKLSIAVDNINSIISNMDVLVKNEMPNVRASLIKFGKAADELSEVLSFIKNGKGALGKLATDKKLEKDLKETIRSLRIFSKMMEEAPSKWIIDGKKAKEVKKELEKEEKKRR
ncbi:MlaD family protein [Elusimicrobiota bacterium]